MAPNRYRQVDKLAGIAWDLSIPGEHLGSISDLLRIGGEARIGRVEPH